MNYKKPREIIAAHKNIIALDILADDLRDMKDKIEKNAKLTCLERAKENKGFPKINVLQLNYETGKEIQKELILYFNLEENTSDKKIAQILTGLLDLVKLQSYLHKRDLGKWGMMLSDIRYILQWYSLQMHLYCHLKDMGPDDLKKELERVG